MNRRLFLGSSAICLLAVCYYPALFRSSVADSTKAQSEPGRNVAWAIPWHIAPSPTITRVSETTRVFLPILISGRQDK